MAYKLDESRTATNYTPGAEAGRGNPEFIFIHHWGIDGQQHDNVVNFFCTPGNGCGTSAHFVASANRVNCIVSPSDVAWHAGDWPMNVRSVGIECRPEATDADYQTVSELIRWLRGMYGNLPLRPHNIQRRGTDGGPGTAYTDCPGRYDLARLDRMARATTTAQSGTITPISKGLFMTLSAAEEKDVLDGARRALRYLDTKTSDVAGKVWATPVKRAGGNVSALQELADSKSESIKANAQVAALQNVIAQIAKGQAIDYAQVGAAVTKALKDGTVQVDVTVAGVK